MKTILITGGAGFVGSNFAIYWKEKYPKDKVICLDNLKRRGSELNLKRLKEKDILFVHGDIRNKEDIQFNEIIDVVVACSAEPSVLAGINESPEYIINSNLIGAINCLEFARKNNSKFIFLSTSRVYPYDKLLNIICKKSDNRFEINNEIKLSGVSKKGISEKFPLEGTRSIYGATKLCVEYLIREYCETYDLQAVINRCGVIAGPWQMGKVDQGVFSLWVARHYFNKPLSYIGFEGKGLQVRDLIHIKDLSKLIDLQINNFGICNKKIYNVGGGFKNSLSLIETTRLCERITKNKIKITGIKKTRPADIPLYISDNSLVEKEFKWSIKISPEEILRDIYNWIRNNEGNLKNIF